MNRFVAFLAVLLTTQFVVPIVFAEVGLFVDESFPEGRQVRIFDGTEKTIGFRSSSHGGQREFIELVRMVPGGEKIKAKALWLVPRKDKDGADVAEKYPIVVRRMNNNFQPSFKIKGPDDQKGIAAGVAVLVKAMEADKKTGHKAVFYHAGHYNENTSKDQIIFIRNSGLAYQAMADQNTDPRFYFLDTITPTYKHFPATVKSDGFHANSIANYLEGLLVVKAMCEHDGIEFPEAIETFVNEKVATAADKAEIIQVTFPDFTVPIDTELRRGDQITVRWKVNQPEDESQKVEAVYVTIHSVFRDDFYISGKLPVPADGQMEYTWTVKSELPEFRYRSRDRRPPNKSKIKTVTNRRSHQMKYCIRVFTADLAKSNEIYNFSTRFHINMGAKPRETPMVLKPEPVVESPATQPDSKPVEP